MMGEQMKDKKVKVRINNVKIIKTQKDFCELLFETVDDCEQKTDNGED